MTHPPVANYYLGDSGFSVYEEMGRQLNAMHWRRRPEARRTRCDLVLGDRCQIPYGELRCTPLPSSSFFGGVRWVNYFQGSHRLTLKASMAELLRTADATCEEWMPHTFVLGGPQYRCFDDRRAFLSAAQESPMAVWIIKPSNGAKGESITMVRGYEEAARYVREKLELDPESKKRYAVQRYVESPLLLSHGRKFDVRVWVLLTSPYSIYAFTQGSCRTASLPFDLADIQNVHGHLTNHCLQESSEAFGRFEPGNEMWFPQLDAYLSASEKEGKGLGLAPGTLATVILPRMANIIVRSLLAMKSQMETVAMEPIRCFQLFGYDFIIESNLAVKLLEINGSPGVAERYLPTVVDSMLTTLGCMAADAVRAEIASGAPTGTSRDWSITKESFVLLWQVGDSLPDGLAV